MAKVAVEVQQGKRVADRYKLVAECGESCAVFGNF
jgi:hypothetical protein